MLIDVMSADDAFQQRRILNGPLAKIAESHGETVTGDQVVQDSRLITRLAEQFRRMTPDEACSTGN